MKPSKKLISFCCATLLTANLLINSGTALASTGVEKTYTTDADFFQGTSINLSNKVPDQLQLDDTTKPFGFVWVAVSSKGTAVKIDTETGKILGEYKTAPSGQPTDPSRTTVDKNGSVWVSNRAGNSITRICLPESGLWIDKNGNGKCDTSTGYGDIKPWTNANNADTNGGVVTAEDECIINYVKVSSSGTRHVSVDKNNDVWVSGTGNRIFNLIDGITGTIKRTEGPVGYGGYGGLIDKNNVIWSSNALLRWDTSKPLSGSNGINWRGYGHDSYGLAIDNQGNVWNTSLFGNQIRKFSPDGNLIGIFAHGSYYAQGCVADSNGDIWVAQSLWGNTVGHIKNDGKFVGVVSVGSGPTGVAVDANGKIWVTNYYSGTVSRIDPNLGPIGNDGVTRVGAVDFTTPHLGGNLYNYSDMTGSTLIGAPDLGSWSTVYDSQAADTNWGTIDWNSLVSDNGLLTVSVDSSNDGSNFSSQETVESGNLMNVPNGRYLRVTVNFKRASTGVSPILYDLTVKTENSNNPPVAEINGPYSGVEGSDIVFDASGSTDVDGDVLKYRWDFDNDGNWDTEWSGSPTVTYKWADNWTGKAKLEVTDGNLTASDICDVTVNNVNPNIDDFTIPISPNPISSLVSTSASFSDPGMLDTHNAVWNWGDGTASPAAINGNNGSGTLTGAHTYTSVGVYTVSLTVTDKDGGSDTVISKEYVVVFDPSEGFVTGGGWINSPEGAYSANPLLTGKATFGFVSKYQKGANIPTGNTQFIFHAAGMNFKSTYYDWLVVAGAKAQYKGSGTIDGQGDCEFMLSIVDGNINGGDDRFRIKIKDKITSEIIYDNQLGLDESAELTTVLGGGSIVIHKK